MNLIFLKRFRACLASSLLKWLPDLVIAGYFPGRIGLYLVIDTLIVWSENDAAI